MSIRDEIKALDEAIDYLPDEYSSLRDMFNDIQIRLENEATILEKSIIIPNKYEVELIEWCDMDEAYHINIRHDDFLFCFDDILVGSEDDAMVAIQEAIEQVKILNK